MHGYKVGDRVGFKAGVERYGKITAISGGYAKVDEWDGNLGEYVENTVALNRLWRDE